MFESIMNFFRNMGKADKKENNSRDTAKERLHLVLMQDRANVSADFLDLMRQEIIEVIKKYVDIDESEIDVRMTNKQNEDGSNGTPLLYANIPIVNIKNDILVEKKKEAEELKKQNENPERVENSSYKEQEGNQNNAEIVENNVQENAQDTEENNEPRIEENTAQTLSQN